MKISFSPKSISPFVLVCPVRNAEQYIQKCLTSICQQTFIPWHLIIIDDCSTDSTPVLIEDYIKSNKIEKQTTFIINNERKFALWNVNFAIKNFISDTNPIIGIIDGDDWFSTDKALEIVWDAYKDGSDLIWTQHICYPSERIGYSMLAKKEDPRHLRRGISHFKTFRKSLFLEIPEKEFLDLNGCFFKFTYDKAITYPLSELSNKMKFINQILYVYNRMSNNVDKEHAQEQYDVALYLESKPSLSESPKILSP